MALPSTLQEAIIYFAEPKNCNEFLAGLRWTDGKVKCPYCGSDNVSYLASVNRYKCYGKHPKAQFSLKVGTIFEDSPISLDKWLCAMWLIVNCKNGISSCEMARDLGITQKSAWFLDHRIRFALHSGSIREAIRSRRSGRNLHRWQGAEYARSATPAPNHWDWHQGQDSRYGHPGTRQGRQEQVRTSVIPNRKKTAIQGEVSKHVEAGSALYTDFLLSYEGLAGEYAHKVVDHAVEYVHGNVHTNGLENYWSLLKRTISGNLR